MGSRIKEHITATAINLFADRGYHGVSTRDVAAMAKVTEGSIYRIFVTKDGLFKAALEMVLHQALDPAQFLMMIYESEDKPDKPALLTAAIMRWYSSLTPSGARLLTQAYFLEEWRDFAYAPISKIIGILAKTLQRDAGISGASADDLAIATQAPIHALLQFKLTYATACSAKEETETVTGIIRQWLNFMMPHR